MKGFPTKKKHKYKRSANTYGIYVETGFRNGGHPIDDAEWPETVRLKRKYKSLPDLFYVLYGLMMVSSAMRDLLEEIDPGVHVFKDIDFDYETDKTYYGFWTPTNLQTINIDASNPSSVFWFEDGKSTNPTMVKSGQPELFLMQSRQRDAGFGATQPCLRPDLSP